MTDERIHRADTDEPDGVTALQASLRQPGESLPGATTGDDLADLPAEDASPAGDTSRAGYDVDAVSGAVDPNP
ncbi:hypothetical protein [Micromonospora costi]|uniref:Uncharacterized protein n=1 Tax=Micromonospora costi TaxID=1530042 RepID=A0A3A9ZNQ9_9ACTN|nr:hypothetical protein [Micromonospora costi]RKN49832.1 hypothetical protein D7193_32050 [Micromonospora costi]